MLRNPGQGKDEMKATEDLIVAACEKIGLADVAEPIASTITGTLNALKSLICW